MTRRLPLLAVATLAPLVVTAIAVVVGVAVAPALDAPVAVHWGPDGRPDHVAPAWAAIAGFASVSLVVTGLLSAALAAGGVHVVTRLTKQLALVPIIVAGLLGVLQVWIVTAPTEGPTVVVALLVAVATAGVLGAAGWVVLPAPTAESGGGGRAAEALPLAPGERAVWLAGAAMTRGARVALLAGIVLAVAGVTTATVVTRGAAWPLYLIPALLIVAFATTTVWSVRVDDAGLVVRGAAGFPVFRVPAADVAEAGTVDVRPLGDFGGWGIRQGAGRRFGVVMRAGEALQVIRRDGRTVVVTVDDAATAAGLLTAVAARVSREP